MSSDTMLKIPGYRIPGYKIEGELGRGGMASVYQALQESLNRKVALKVMNPVLTTDEEFTKRFLNEGHIVGQLNHSNIVTVFDIGEHEGHYYLAMELLPGGSLRDRIKRGLPVARALEYSKNLAIALGYAHQRGFVHRDIKPLNVLFREDDSPVLTDFGIAKALGSSTQMTKTGYAFGSVGYMSPEQSLGKPIDHRADLYSFGAMYWEMLTGSRLYEAEDAFALALKHATAPIPELPGELRVFQPTLDKLLAKQPDDRYNVIEQFVTELDQIEKNLQKENTADSHSLVNDATSTKAARFNYTTSNSNNAEISSGLGMGAKLAFALVALVLLGGGAMFMVPSLNPFTASGPKTSEATTASQAKPETETTPVAVATEPVAVATDPQPSQAELAQQAAAALQEQQVQAARNKSAQIQQLLTQAQIFWEAGQFTDPADSNASENYRKVLELDPDNSLARSRMLELGKMINAERAREKARKLFDTGKLEASLAEIESGLRFAPDLPALLALREQVHQQIAATESTVSNTSTIDELLQQAEQQMAASRYTEPPGDNAFDSYRQVLNLEPDNATARAGLVSVGQIRNGQRAQQAAEELLQAGDLEASLAEIEKGLRRAPGFSGLLELQQRVRAQLE